MCIITKKDFGVSAPHVGNQDNVDTVYTEKRL
jgi:hypothetical protein